MMTPTLLTAWQLGRSFDAWDIEQITACVRSNLCFHCSVFTLWPAVAVAKNFYPIYNYIYIYIQMIISLLATATAGHEINTCLSEETRLESSNAVAVKYLAPSSTAGRRKDMGIAEPHSETSCTGDAWNLPWSEPSCGLKPTVLRGENCCHLTPVSFPKHASPFSRSNHIKSPRLSHDHTRLPWLSLLNQ